MYTILQTLAKHLLRAQRLISNIYSFFIIICYYYLRLLFIYYLFSLLFCSEKSFVKFIPGWDNKDTIKPAPTVIVKPQTAGNPFTFDIHYVDHMTLFDIFNHNSTIHPPCYIVPPYKPIAYIAGVSSLPISIYLIDGIY